MKYYTSLLFFLLTSICQGQEGPSSVTDELYFDALTTADGLPSQIIHNTYQDSEGYMWVSTEEAVVRYDGYEFKPYYENLTEGVNLRGATNFYEDRGGQLWAINGGGILHRYHRNDGRFEHISLPLEGGWSVASVHGIAEDKSGNLWIAGHGGIQYYNPLQDTVIVYPLEAVRSPQSWPHPEKVRLGQIYLDEDKAIWAATRKFGLVRFDLHTKEFKLYRFEDGYSGVNLDDWITDIVPVQDGKLMMSDHAEGVVIWDLDKEEVIHKINPSELLGLTTDAAISDLYYEGGTQIWISTEEQGLILLDYKSKRIITQYRSGVNERVDSPGDKVTHVNRDRTGNFWLGSSALLRGNLKYQLEHFNHDPSDPSSLRHDRVFWLSKDADGRILVSTDEGLSIFNPKLKKFDNSLTIADVTARSFGVYADDDYYWIGNYTYLNKLDRETYQLESRFKRDIVVDTSNNILRRACRIIKDSQDVIWMIDHWGRLKRIDESSNSITNVYELAQDQVSKIFVNVIAIIDDPQRQQIIAATDLGVATVSYDGTKVEKKQLSYRDTDLTQSVYSYMFRDQNGDVWVIISGKIYKLDLDNWGLTYLPLNEPYDIGSFSWVVDDSHGIYWLASFKGILRFDPVDSSGSMFYTPNIGGYKFESSSPVVVENDKIYFSGRKGMSVLDTRKIIINEVTNPVVITTLEVNQEIYNRNGQSSSIQLDYKKNDIDVSFSTMEFVGQEEAQYQYRLLPRDQEWIDNETNNSLKLYNLEPDDYTLEIKGTNSDGVWDPSITELSINISPPWWSTLWAKLIAILAGIGLVLYGQRYRYQQQLHQQNRVIALRDKISRDLHDDVGTILTGVAMQSELLELTATEQTQPIVKHIAQRSRQAMTQLRDTVWAMDSSKDGLADLQERIMDFIDETLRERGINVKYDFTANPDEIIRPDIRQAIYLISKESATNIAKHSDASEVSVKLIKEKNTIKLVIQDNGTKKQELKSSGVGLNNMNRRATQLGGSYIFVYQEGYLTKVDIPHTSA